MLNRLRGTLVVLFLFVPGLVAAQEVPPGEDPPIVDHTTYIETDTTWTRGSQHVLDTDIVVLPGATLTIEPGAQIRFAPTGEAGSQGLLFIDGGRILALGTATEPILFAPASEAATFNITFSGDIEGDPSSFQYVQFISGGRPETLLPPGPGGDLSTDPGVATFFFGVGKLHMEHALFRGSKYTDIQAGSGLKKVGVPIYFEVTESSFEQGVGEASERAVITSTDPCPPYFDQCENSLLFQNNWWGAATGPQHASNQAGTGKAIVGPVVFAPWLDHTPIPANMTCSERCFSSILFLPGLEASRLYRPSLLGEDQLWEPNISGDAEDIFLDAHGKSIRDDIYTKDVIDNAYIPGTGNVYQAFLADLARWKNDEGLIADYAVTPYDWRLTLAEIVQGGKQNGEHISYTEPSDTAYIVGELGRLAASSRSGKVTIVAHSNGGLVAKALVNTLGTEAEHLIDKLVLVAVPQSGTPQTIGAILHGFDQGLPLDWFPFALTPQMARTLANNMSSAYQLLPSERYFSGSGSAVATPIITFEDGAATATLIEAYGHSISTPSRLHSFLLNATGKVAPDTNALTTPSTINTELLLASEAVQPTLDEWTLPPGIILYQVAGFGAPTLGSIKYWNGETCLHTGGAICSARVPALEYTPELVIDGDGTVVAPSALAMSDITANVSRWWVDLGQYNKENSTGRKHASVLEVPQLRSFIKENILTGQTTILPDFISASEPPTTSEKRLEYFLHSPLALSARNESGQVISATEESYPGASYQRFGEVQYLSVPAESAPTLVMQGLDTGSFTLEVQETTGGALTETTTFSAIPTSADTRVTMAFSDGTIEHAAPLSVDYDGDGTLEYSLPPQPGEVVTIDPVDTTPPTTAHVLAGTPGTSPWYVSNILVTLTATDTDTIPESNIKTQYSLNQGNTWQPYTEPFTLTQEGTTILQYFSTDTAGNQETIQAVTLQIDKTAPEGIIAFDPMAHALSVAGQDNLGGPVTVTLTHSNTKSASKISHQIAKLTDTAGQTTTLVFEQTNNDEAGSLLVKLQSIEYPGEKKFSPQVLAQYRWPKNGKEERLASFLRVTETSVEAHYLPERDETWIMERPREGGEIDTGFDLRPVRQKLSGLVVPYLETEAGRVEIKY